jgi:hypothetical protein
VGFFDSRYARDFDIGRAVQFGFEHTRQFAHLHAEIVNGRPGGILV